MDGFGGGWIIADIPYGVGIRTKWPISSEKWSITRTIFSFSGDFSINTVFISSSAALFV